MSELPSVTVVLAVRNEARYLKATLDSIFAQDYAGVWDVVAAEGGSTDQTREVLAHRAAQEPRLRVVDNPGHTASAGLNRALAASHGEVVVRCDGHSQLAPDYISQAVQTLQETGAANVGGAQNATGESLRQKVVAIAMTSPFGMGNSRFRYTSQPGPAETVYLGVFRRTALQQVGGFDERLQRNQDFELNFRLRQAGETVWFDPRVRAVYHPRDTWRELWKQYYNYGRGKRVVIKRHPRSAAMRHYAPPLLLAGLVLSGILLAGGFWPAAGFPALYAMFLLLATGVETVRRRDWRALLLPDTLATMHLAWASGFLLAPAPKSPAGSASPPKTPGSGK